MTKRKWTSKGLGWMVDVPREPKAHEGRYPRKLKELRRMLPKGIIVESFYANIGGMCIRGPLRSCLDFKKMVEKKGLATVEKNECWSLV